MGTGIKIGKKNNLYEYWNSKINQHLNKILSTEKTLINLASNEYSKAAQLKKIRGRIITPVFKELRGDSFKVITIYAKKARGLMTRFIIKNRLEDPEQLKLFDSEGYFYNETLSDENTWTYSR